MLNIKKLIYLRIMCLCFLQTKASKCTQNSREKAEHVSFSLPTSSHFYNVVEFYINRCETTCRFKLQMVRNRRLVVFRLHF